MGEKHDGKATASGFKLNSSYGIAKEHIVDMGKENAKRLGSSHTQAAGQCVGFVAKLGDGDPNAFRNGWTDGFTPANMA